MEIAKTLRDQFVIALHEPRPVLAVAVLLFVGMRLYFKSYYAGRLADAESTEKLLERQVQEYKDKLSGASPDEARARFAALEERIAELTPPCLTAKQRDAIARGLSGIGGILTVVEDLSASKPVRRLTHEIRAAVSAGGWSAGTGQIIAPLNRPPAALTLYVSEEPNPYRDRVISAFSEAGLELGIARPDIIINGTMTLLVSSLP